MSFQNIETINIDTVTINHEPYPPSGEGITVASNSVNTQQTLLFRDPVSSTSTLFANSNLNYNPSSGVLNNVGGTISNHIYTAPSGTDVDISSVSADVNIFGDVNLSATTASNNIVLSSTNGISITTSGSNATGGINIQTGIATAPNAPLNIQSSGPMTILPANSTGTAGYVLGNLDGAGTVGWVAQSGGGGTIIGVPPTVCFVSSLIGNDSNDGSIYNPVATLTQALILCAPAIPNPGCVIYCFDASSFDENIDLHGNVVIYAPYASIDCTNGSDTITTNVLAAGNSITFQYMQNNSARYVINNLIGYLNVNVVTIFPGNSIGMTNASGRPAILNITNSCYVAVGSTSGTWIISCPTNPAAFGGSFDSSCYSFFTNSLTPSP